jgi:hypothetical protein
VASASDGEVEPAVYNQRRRLKSLHEAREAVGAAMDRVDDGLFGGEIDAFTANTVIRRAVERYIYEVEWVIEEWRDGKDGEGDDAPVEGEDYRDYLESVGLGSMQLPNGRDRVFVGLWSITDCPDPIEVEVEVEETGELGPDTETVTKRTQIPRDVLVQAYRLMNRWMRDVKLDVQFDDEDHVTEITEEMLEEVAEWRRQHLPELGN